MEYKGSQKKFAPESTKMERLPNLCRARSKSTPILLKSTATMRLRKCNARFCTMNQYVPRSCKYKTEMWIILSCTFIKVKRFAKMVN